MKSPREPSRASVEFGILSDAAATTGLPLRPFAIDRLVVVISGMIMCWRRKSASPLPIFWITTLSVWRNSIEEDFAEPFRRGAEGAHPRVPRAVRRGRVPRRPVARGVRHGPRGRLAGCSASATTTCRSWAAPPSTWATSPRCAPVRARPWPVRSRRTFNALSGKGVHVVTVNDYLAERDSEWMGRVHRFLGLEVGCILANMPPDERRRQVRRRHHLRHQQRVRLRLPARQHGVDSSRSSSSAATNFAVVDEVDSILIDEARTLLIISGPARPGHQVVRRVRQDRPAPPQARRGGKDGTGEHRRLRGRREEAHRRHPRVRRREGRGLAGHRQPLQVGAHPPRPAT